MVPSRIPKTLRQEVAELQCGQEFMEKVDSTEVRETRMVIGDSRTPWRSTYCQPYLTKSCEATVPQQASDPHQTGIWTAF